jgi:hypothetical protein
MNSSSIGSAYWGLPGLTNTTFKVRPLPEDGSTTPWETEFVRTGLLGFLGPVRFLLQFCPGLEFTKQNMKLTLKFRLFQF